MLQPKKLLPVPSTFEELTIKAMPSGIVVLKDGRYRKRYVGSSGCAVDINGKLWMNSAELRKHCSDEGKKIALRLPTQGKKVICSNKDKDEKDLSTKKNNPREYHVNKVKVRQRLMAMINTMQGGKELYFWTVTFPEGTTDEIAYQAYNTWLTSLRQRRMLREYLWVAERQKNGTVHFHLAIPHKMSVHRANSMMQGTLKTFARRGKIPFSIYQCKRYNGIDIAKNRNTRRVTNFAIKKGNRALTTYLTKYVTKNDAGFSHLAWHNSRAFSALFTGITFTTEEFLGYGFRCLLHPASVINTEYFMFFKWKDQPPDAVMKHLYELNSYVHDRIITK